MDPRSSINAMAKRSGEPTTLPGGLHPANDLGEGSPSSTSLSNDASDPIDPSTKNEALSIHLVHLSSHPEQSREIQDPGLPPDGGIKAWTQVLCAHLVVFNSWGYISSFGVFQAYYARTLDKSASDISWVGSIQIFLIYFCSTFSGRATDAGYYRHVIVAGLLLQLVGVFMTSLSTQYWQLFLAQGVCQGLGDGLVFCPTVTLIATYFLKKRALAISCIASGFVTGGVVFTLIARQLLYKIGFPWTLRIMGFVILANAAIILTLARTRIPPRITGPLIEWAAFKEISYALFSAGMFLAFLGVYVAYYYVSQATITVFSRGTILNASRSLRLRKISSGSPRRLLSTFCWS